MAQDFNTSPYFDDFDPKKNFYRILFKPGFAVQARELTQSQSILQDQVSKFGNGIYQDGSKVTGGNISVDTNITTGKLTSASASTIISNLPNYYAVGATSKFIGQVVEVDVSNFYIKTKGVNTTNNKQFLSGETINFYATKIEALDSIFNTSITPSYTATLTSEFTFTRTGVAQYLSNQITMAVAGINKGDTITYNDINFNAVVIDFVDANTVVINKSWPSQDVTSATFTVINRASVQALEVSIDEGVWYTNGFFVRNKIDHIIPDALNAYPSVVVGFEVDDTKVDSVNDPSLLDPAIGASNYQAPGADRYQINLALTTKPYTSTQTVSNLTTVKFIELVRINQGVVEVLNNVPIYSELQKSISQGIYDQSGDFIVNSFKLDVGESLSSVSKLPASISAGKAYIKGNPVEHIATTQYYLEKARDIDTLNTQSIASYYGDYTPVKNLHGSIINFQTGTQVELHNAVFHAASTATKIGTARVRNFDYVAGTSNSNTEYNTFLFDVQISNDSFSNVKSMIIPGAGNDYSGVVFSANTVTPTVLTDGNYNSLIFPLPQTNISNVTSVGYTTRKVFTKSFINGVTTINSDGTYETFVGGSGNISAPERQLNYAVVTSGGNFVPMEASNVIITISNTPGTPQATINLGSSFTGTGTVYATLSIGNDIINIKNKVLNSNTTVVVSANTINAPIDLGLSDIYQFKRIAVMGNTGSYSGNWANTTTYNVNQFVTYTDGNIYYSLTGSNQNNNPVTSTSNWAIAPNAVSDFIVDNGQRDTLYDHGSITNVSGFAKGNVVVLFDYFTHSGGKGFFTVDSYPVDYGAIPSFTSPQYGKTYSLRDVIDFRPRRTDSATTIDQYQLPAPFTNLLSSYSYYLGRSDKVVLYPNGQFKTLRGVSSYTNSLPPADVPGAMTLFTLQLAPYTFNSKGVISSPTNLKRYTMRDIGVLDQRISNIEYYTSLSLLEKEVTGSDVTDATGTALLFKNGFLVDSFKGQGVADVQNPDYATSIDFTHQLGRPLFQSNVAKYIVDTSGGAFKHTAGKQNNQLFVKNNMVTFSYDEVPIVNQTIATEIINVNPFNVTNFVGGASLSPASDVWYDTTTQPSVNIVNEDQAAWQAAVSGTGHGSQWNDWQLNWTGQNVVSTNDQAQISRDVTAITTAIASKGLSGATTGGNIQVSSTTKVISDAVIPYARNIPISFKIDALAPQTRIHTFINGQNIDSYVTPAPTYSDTLYKIDINYGGSGYSDGNNQSIITITGNCTTQATATANVSGGQIVAVNVISGGSGYLSTPVITLTGVNQTAQLSANTYSITGSSLMTNKNGHVEGTLTIPNDKFLHFPTGTLLIEFGDNFLSPSTAQTYAKATFQSKGTLETSQTTIVSTRPPQTTPKPQVTSTTVVTGTSSTTAAKPTDPVAVTYPLVSTVNTPAGTSNTTFISSTGKVETIYDKNACAFSDANTAILYIQTYLDTIAKNQVPTVTSNVINAINSTVASSYITIYNALKANTGSTPTGTEVMASYLYALNIGFAGSADPIGDTVKQIAIASANGQGSNNAQAYLDAQGGQTAGAQTAAGKATASLLNGTDPLSQNFYVDATKYPRGVFVSSVDVYFATKDSTIPVSVRLRKVINGYPDAVYDIPGSIVYKNPGDINLPTSNTAAGLGPATTFEFDFPVYLDPDQYSILVATDSNKYTVYASKMGEAELGTGNLVTQVTYSGVLFKSQNASTWVPAPGEQLCFNLKVCSFAGGSASFNIKSLAQIPAYYDLIQLMTQDLTFNHFDSINYQVTTLDATSNATYGPVSVFANQNYAFNTRQKISSLGDLIVTPTITNSDIYTSPVIDIERLNTVLVTNVINPWSTANSNSELISGFGNGMAAARYMTRRITLANNFDSTGLTVYLDVNRQPGTKIEVFYKVLNALDSNNFDDQPYVLMAPKFTAGGTLAVTGPTDWTTDTYQALNISYNDIKSGYTYNNFKVFAIKVVLYSDNPAIVPEIKNLRTIATA